MAIFAVIYNALLGVSKGDLIIGTPNGNSGKLSVGTDGQVLTADSTQTNGLKWTTPSAGGTPGGSSGQVQFNNAGAFGGAAGLSYQSGASPNVTITAQGATYVPLVVQGAVSQSTFLTRWLNSSGSLKAWINYDGSAGIMSSDTSYNGALIVGGQIKVATGGLDITGNISLASGRVNHSGTGVTNISFNSAGTNYGLIQNDAADVWSIATGVSNSSLGTPCITWLKSTLVGINQVTPTAQLHIVNSVASNVATIVKGSASQSADLQQWQDSSGTVLTKVDKSGVITSTTIDNQNAIIGNANANSNGNKYFGVYGFSAGNVSSLKAALYGFAYGSGGTNFGVIGVANNGGGGTNCGGYFTGFASGVSPSLTVPGNCSLAVDSLSSSGTTAYFMVGGTAFMTLSGSAAQNCLLVASGATLIPLVVKGAASQSGDLQEWQDNNNNVLACVKSNGVLVTPGIQSAKSILNGAW